MKTPPTEWQELATPSTVGSFIAPPDAPGIRPICGHHDGLRIGLAPMPGPRGLIRIYAPYLNHPISRMINYIAIEPIAKGETKRGFSELEYSALDLEQGKRFWFDDHHELTDDSLSTAIDIEPFDNGAHLFLTIEFRRDNPHEVSVGTYCHDDSAELDHVILTATMGNYARLRKLRLARDDVSAADLWPDFSGDAFAPHRRFARDTLCSSDGTDVLLEAISDEADASAAQYSEDTAPHWKYEGKSALQY